LTHLKELSKQNYFRSMFNKYNNNVKKTWQLINNIITLKKIKNTTLPKIRDQTTSLNVKN